MAGSRRHSWRLLLAALLAILFAGSLRAQVLGGDGGVFQLKPGSVTGPDLGSGAACFNLGPWTGALTGPACSSPSLAPGAAANNIGALGGALQGSLPNPTLSPLAVVTAIGAPGGDVQGTSYTATLVTGLQGFPISSTPPSVGTALVWNGSQYTPTPQAPGITQLVGAVTTPQGSGTQTATLSSSVVTNANLVNGPGFTIKGNPNAAVGAETDLPITGQLAFVSGALGIAATGFPAGSYTIGADCWTFNASGQATSYTAGTGCNAGSQLTADDGSTILTADDGSTQIVADSGGGGGTPCSTNLVADWSDTTGCNLIFKMVAFR